MVLAGWLARCGVVRADEPTATPTPDAGCAYFEEAATAVESTVAASFADTAPAWQWCTADIGDGQVAVSVARGTAAAPFQTTASNLLLRWDAAPQPLDYTVMQAWLRLYVTGVTDDNSRSLGADWQAWTTCAATVHTDATLSAALASGGNCGAACMLANVVPDQDNDFALDGLSALAAPGPVALRLNVPFNGTLTGSDGMAVAPGPVTHPGPRLVVLACDLGTPGPILPTPTPTPDCEEIVLDAAGHGGDARNMDTSFPPAFDMCVYDETRVAGHAVSAGPLYESSTALLSWDTSEIPAALVVADARLRLAVGEVEHDDLRSLTGDWYDWGETCGERDAVDDDPPVTALSSHGACGGACSLWAMTPEADNDFALDDAATEVNREGVTSLRLHVAGEPEQGANTVEFADGSEATPGPRLVVDACVPTPTPVPEGCAVVVIDASVTDQAIATGESFPPEFASCTNSLAMAESSWLEGSETFERRTLLARWDLLSSLEAVLEQLPPELLPYAPELEIPHAWLRLTPAEVWDADGLSLVADWRQWSCGASDDAATNWATALSPASTCGPACALGALLPGHHVDLPLEEADALVNNLGRLAMRVQVDGTPETGRNGFELASPPQLVGQVCLPSPSPTPEPGCHYETFTPDGDAYTALAFGEDYPPEFDHCEAELDFRLSGGLYVAWGFVGIDGWLGANTLVRWDTSPLPEDAVITGAWLKAAVATTQGVLPEATDTLSSLSADWYDWGEECDETDYTAEPSSGAISVDGLCGEACRLVNIPAARAVRLPLDDADVEIDRDGTTALRLSVDVGLSPGTNMFAMADISILGLVPELVVHWCEPMPTPTPASCCVAHEHTGGCSDSECATCVGEHFGGCDWQWTQECADVAGTECASECGCPAYTPTPVPTPTEEPTVTPTWDPGVPTYTPTDTPTATATPTSTVTPTLQNTLAVEVLYEHGVGDGSPATDVPIGAVTDIAVDSARQRIYFVDAVHRRVRQIDADGNIQTLLRAIGSAPVPSGAISFAGLAVDPENGRLYVSDSTANRVWAVEDGSVTVFAGTSGEDGGDDGPATEARLVDPQDVEVGSEGTVFIAERGADRIRSVILNGTISTAAAELPVDLEACAGLSPDTKFSPTRLAIAPDGAIYVTGKSGTCVEKVVVGTSVEALPRIVRHIHGMTVFGDGRLFLSAAGLFRQGESEWTPAFPEASTESVDAITTSGDDLIGYDSEAHHMVRIDPEGTPTVIAGNGTGAWFGDDGPANGAGFSCAGIAVSSSGTLYLGDTLNARIAKIDTGGVIDTVVGGPVGDGGQPDTRIGSPAGMAIGEDDSVYVADPAKHQVVRIDAEGEFSIIAGTGTQGYSGDGGLATVARLDAPTSVAVIPGGSLAILEGSNRRVRRVDESGAISTLAVLAESVPGGPAAMAALGDGSLILTGATPGHLLRIGIDGVQTDLDVDAEFPESIPLLQVLGAAGDAVILFARGQVLIGTVGASPVSVDQYVLLEPANADGLSDISAGAVNPDGALVLCDRANRRIIRLMLPSEEE